MRIGFYAARQDAALRLCESQRLVPRPRAPRAPDGAEDLLAESAGLRAGSLPRTGGAGALPTGAADPRPRKAAAAEEARHGDDR